MFSDHQKFKVRPSQFVVNKLNSILYQTSKTENEIVEDKALLIGIKKL